MTTTDAMTTTPGTEDPAVGTKVTIERRNDGGELVDLVDLEPAIFGVRPNTALMHQVVTAQLAARRSGTQSTKTRSEVAGGGAKPYRRWHCPRPETPQLCPAHPAQDGPARPPLGPV